MHHTCVSCGSVLRQDCHSVQNEQVLCQLFCVLFYAVVFFDRGQMCSIKMTKVCSAQTHISVGPCRGIVEETPNTTEHGRPSVMLEKYASATKMQPQSSGSLRSNAGIEKGKEIAARLNIHRIHSQLRGLDSTGQIGIKAPLFCCYNTLVFKKTHMFIL